MIPYRKAPCGVTQCTKEYERFMYRRLIGLSFLAYSVINTVSVNRLHATDPREHTMPGSSVLSPRTMTPVPHLFDIIWTDQGGIQKMKTYLDDKGDPNLIESTGQKRSLLEMFAFVGDEEFVDILLRSDKISVSYEDINEHNAFYQVSVANHSTILKRLIAYVREKGTRQELATLINVRDTRGMTSLHIASVKGHEESVSLLLKHGAEVDLTDDHGRTALHLACYMGHEGIVRQLLGFKATVSLTTPEGLTAKDFFRLGETAEDCYRSDEIERLLRDEEQRLGVLHTENQLGQREVFRDDASLNAFMTTFQRKCGSFFLAYRVLESDAIQGTTDIFTVSNAINILGNQVPLPGASLVTTVLSTGVAYVEDQIETRKKEALTHFFTTIREMEEAVEQAAYDLTNHYQPMIRQLTPEGARTLALCGVGRFVEFMRNTRDINNHIPFSTLVFDSIQRVKPKTMMDRLPDLCPWSTLVIETKDSSQRWTECSIFEEAQSSLHDNRLDPILLREMNQYPLDPSSLLVLESRIPSSVTTTPPQHMGHSRGCCLVS